MTAAASRQVSRAVDVPSGRVALSTASVYPESTASGFELAARLGYDGVEVMVGSDETSQDVSALLRLRDYHQLPVVAVHAPCLLLTQRVWGNDPWEKLRRSAEAALDLGADAVVVHPPFRWQRDYARTFLDGISGLEAEYDVAFAVENMFPWRTLGQQIQVYVPGWDPVAERYAHVTLDLSHCATAGTDAMTTAKELGARLTHVHMTDGSGSVKDEHLVPGRGSQPCAALAEHLAASGFHGSVVVEINTRRCETRSDREADVAESLAFTRLHLAAPAAAAP